MSAVSELVPCESLEHFHFSHGGLKMQPIFGCGSGDYGRERTQQNWLLAGDWRTRVQECNTTWRIVCQIVLQLFILSGSFQR